jgi:hypothetical protein
MSRITRLTVNRFESFGALIADQKGHVRPADKGPAVELCLFLEVRSQSLKVKPEAVELLHRASRIGKHDSNGAGAHTGFRIAGLQS